MLARVHYNYQVSRMWQNKLRCLYDHYDDIDDMWMNDCAHSNKSKSMPLNSNQMASKFYDI